MANDAKTTISTLIPSLVSQITSKDAPEDADDDAKAIHAANIAKVSGISSQPEFVTGLAGMYSTDGVFAIDADGLTKIAVAVAQSQRNAAMQEAYDKQDFGAISEVADRFGFDYVNKISGQMVDVATQIADEHANGRQKAWQTVSDLLQKTVNVSGDAYTKAETEAVSFAALYGSDTWSLVLEMESQTTKDDAGNEVTNLVPTFKAVSFDDAHTNRPARKRASSTSGSTASTSSGSGSGSGKETVVEFTGGKASQTFPSARKAGEGLGVQLAKNVSSAGIASKIGNNVNGDSRVIVDGEVKWEAK